MESEGRGKQYWHVTHRYINVTDKVIEVKVTRDKSGATPILPDYTVERGAPAVRVGEQLAKVPVRIYHPSVRLEVVRRGVRWIAGELAKVDGVWLPSELLESV
jgi:hypothetical protein